MDQPMNFKRIIFLSHLTAILVLPSACSSTMLVENWSDPAYQGPPLKKILVIGVIKSDAKRHAFEDEFASLMTAGNRKGIASHTLLPNLEKSGNKEQVLAAVEKAGADGVMIVTTHGLINQQRVTPPTFSYSPNAGMGYGMYGYYNTSHAVTYNPGHTVTDTLLRIDTKLFNVASEKMIWSGKTESFNPTSSREVIGDLERLVIRDMRKSAVIK